MSTLRRLLIVLLLAAVPLQGYAAVSMLYCHARDAGGAAQGHDTHADSHDRHEPGSGHGLGISGAAHAHGDHPATVATAQPAASDDGGDDVPPVPAQSRPDCSVCSAMCVGAAIVASTPNLPAVPDGHAPFWPVASVLAGVVLDLPDPPPLAAPL